MASTGPASTSPYARRNEHMAEENRINANRYAEVQVHARMDDTANKDSLKAADRMGGYV